MCPAPCRQRPERHCFSSRDQGLEHGYLDPVAWFFRRSRVAQLLVHRPVNGADTADLYELVVERHRQAATVITSNREPVEWLTLIADGLLAQSAIDRLQSSAYEYELVLDGDSYRRRQKPTPGAPTDPPPTRRHRRA